MKILDIHFKTSLNLIFGDKMKIEIILLAILLIPTFVSAIQISQVYYNPINTETGGEAIELYNPSNSSLDLSGYVIRTKSSLYDAVLPNDVSIPAQGHFLITDNNWDENKDNASWPSADYEEAITLTNSDAGVALVFNETIIDAVGWGNPENYFEGTPTPEVDEGQSLIRLEDTNNNSHDFSIGIPNFKNSISTDDLILQFTIIDHHTYFTSTDIEDFDNLTEGIQVIPNPGDKRKVFVNTSFTNNSEIISSWVIVNNKRFNLTNNSGFFEMEFYDSSQNYTVEFYANNVYNLTTNVNKSFEYLTITAMDIDGTSLNCEITQGNNCVITGDNDMNTKSNITLKNIGNTPINFYVSGSTPASINSSININSIKYKLENEFINLTQEPVLNEINLESGSYSVNPISFMILANKNSKKGTYQSNIKILATQ